MHQEIIEFWFSPEAKERWFDSTAEFDRLLCERYQSIWEQAGQGELDDWMTTAEGCLALVIVLDQFPLNMFRGEARSFSTEARSIEIARHAIEQDFDGELPDEQKSFLYMPFMHSESLLIHEQAVKLFSLPGMAASNYDFEIKHKKIIERFGRYPHRNTILDRSSTPEELEFLQQPGSSF